MSDQLSLLRERMKSSGADAALVTNLTNIAWLTGFTGSSAFVIVTPTDGVFISDSRYAQQAAEQVQNLPVEIYASPVTAAEKVAEEVKRLGAARLHFEAETMTFASLSSFQQKLNGVEMHPVEELVSPLRLVKSESEILRIRDACALADACYQHVLRMIQPGVSELDIAIDIEFFFRRHGAKPAFDVIAVSGERSSRPHGTPSEKKLQPGEFVTLDFGACLNGYNSDLTRTPILGPASDRHREIYEAVLEAQLRALDAMKPGVACKEIDRISRDSLAKHDLAKFFGHGLGHGLGRLVHDYGALNATSKQVLEPGQVWTVEPGVYIQGFGGVRIEDDVLMTDDGIELLTHAPKELTVL